MNNLGHIVVKAFGHDSYLWTPQSGATPLPKLPSPNPHTEAKAINDLDQVVGMSIAFVDVRFPPSSPAGVAYAASIWQPGQPMKLIGCLPGPYYDSGGRAINNLGVVTGPSVSWCGFQAFVWSKEAGMTGVTAPGGECIANVYDISDAGHLVGSHYNGSKMQAFIIDPQGRFQFLGPPDVDSEAKAVNDYGVVVGGGYGYSFIWDAVNGFRDTKQLPQDAASKKEGPLRPLGGAINNRGQLLGSRDVSPHTRYRFDPFIPGDMNCDGVVDLADLQPFLGQMLKYAGTTPPLFDGEECGWWIGDINQDALLNEDDLAPFLALLP